MNKEIVLRILVRCTTTCEGDGWARFAMIELSKLDIKFINERRQIYTGIKEGHTLIDKRTMTSVCDSDITVMQFWDDSASFYDDGAETNVTLQPGDANPLAERFSIEGYFMLHDNRNHLVITDPKFGIAAEPVRVELQQMVVDATGVCWRGNDRHVNTVSTTLEIPYSVLLKGIL